MDLWRLKPGDTIRTHEGALAQVLSETEDGQWIRVAYLEFAENPGIVGTEDLCHEDEVQGIVRSMSTPARLPR